MSMKEDDCVNIIDGGIDGDGKTHLSYVMRRIDNDGNSGLWIPHTYVDRRDRKEHSYYLAAGNYSDRNSKTYPDGSERILTVKKVPCPSNDKADLFPESKGESKGGRKTRRRKRRRKRKRGGQGKNTTTTTTTTSVKEKETGTKKPKLTCAGKRYAFGRCMREVPVIAAQEGWLSQGRTNYAQGLMGWPSPKGGKRKRRKRKTRRRKTRRRKRRRSKTRRKRHRMRGGR